MKKLFLTIVTIVLFVLVLPILFVQGQNQQPSGKFRRVPRAIPNQYVVVLKENTARSNVASIADELASVHGGVRNHIYRYALKGFSVQLPEAAAIALSQDPRVEFVEEDSEVSIDTTQFNPPNWGLDRIDQRDRPLNDKYKYSNTGANVNVYVMDSGIRPTHVDFGGRAFIGVDFVSDGQNGNDCNGHGTHVAGIVGGSTYGVAKEVRIYAVRVLDCNGVGFVSRTIRGIDWITADVTINNKRPAVANMSLGGGPSDAQEAAVRESIASGVTYVVSAGNSNMDASTQSPARVTQALTIGASTRSDEMTGFSNSGPLVDLFAPGLDITSAWYTSDTASNILPGTSQAAPHVAGVAAIYLQTNRRASPSTVSESIIYNASIGKLRFLRGGSPDRLLYSPPPQFSNYSLSLNGTNAYVSVPNSSSLNVTGPVTVEAWIKTNSPTAQQGIIERYGATGIGTDGGYALRLSGGYL
ncbi:MAG TPA: S8 family serine peptidase, partial [Nitrososphaera sp.]|nr:S8 family serine peptidase [Nitrososphaera sp.]